MNDNKTHFGYKEVSFEEKRKRVAGVFHSVASKYDLMNDVISFGSHRFLKRLSLEYTLLRPGHVVLDLAGGTGDMSKMFSDIVGNSGHVVLGDINESMLSEGRDRLINSGLVNNISYALINGEELPFPKESFDCVFIGFGLRNFNHKEKALSSIYDCLKAGSSLLVLEFSKPRHPIVSKLYKHYTATVWPKLGALITGDAPSYQYLAESIQKHPDQETLKNMMLSCGFEKVKVVDFFAGAVALHVAYKS